MKMKLNITPRKVAKFSVRTAIGVCTTTVVNKVVDSVINMDELDAQETVAIRIGTVGVGYAASDIVGNATDNFVDAAFDLVSNEKSEEPLVDTIIIDHEETE